MNHWNPVLYENRNLVQVSTDPNYFLTTDFADRAIASARRVKSISPQRPFFLYVAPGATHAPHHATTEWSEDLPAWYPGQIGLPNEASPRILNKSWASFSDQ